MPRFYFHAKDGKLLIDEEGTLLRDVSAARTEALKILCQTLPLMEESLFRDSGYTLSVVDEHGLTLFTFDLAVTSAPAVRGLG